MARLSVHQLKATLPTSQHKKQNQEARLGKVPRGWDSTEQINKSKSKGVSINNKYFIVQVTLLLLFTSLLPSMHTGESIQEKLTLPEPS